MSAHIVLPLRWTANQLGGIAPTLGLVAILVLPAVLRSGPPGYGGFPRRYVLGSIRRSWPSAVP